MVEMSGIMEVDQGEGRPHPGIHIDPIVFAKIERIDETGEEYPEKEWNEEELFVRSVVALEEERFKKKTKKRKSETEDAEKEEEEKQDQSIVEENIIDPRVYYRPIVAALQAGNVELHQLINVVDLLRAKQFLEEAYCIREDVLPKLRDFKLLINTKAQQMKDAAGILSTHVESLKIAIQKERRYHTSMEKLLARWKLCLPGHGSFPKPLRSGEQFAVDCSYESAGSKFSPKDIPLGDIAYAELQQTALGFVQVVNPESHVAKTFEVEIQSDTGLKGSFIASGFSIPVMPSEKDRLIETEEDKDLQMYNTQLLQTIRHSIFCEEILQTVVEEALHPQSQWMQSMGNQADISGMSKTFVVLHVLDDEVKIGINATHSLIVRLVDASSSRGADTKALDVGLSALCRDASLLLQREVRRKHGSRNRGNPSKKLSDSIFGFSSTPEPRDEVLLQLIPSVAHALLKRAVNHFLDVFSSRLCALDVDSIPTKVMLDISNQPYCDSVEGIFMRIRWKQSNRADFSAFDLYIGKRYVTEVVLESNCIIFGPGSIAHWGPLSPGSYRCGSLAEFKKHMCTLVCQQITESLYLEAKALGAEAVLIDADHLSIVVQDSAKWSGKIVENTSRISDDKFPDALLIYPNFLENGFLHIVCIIYNMKASSTLKHLLEECSDGNDESLRIDWRKIPGHNDSSKLYYLLRHTEIVSE